MFELIESTLALTAFDIELEVTLRGEYIKKNRLINANSKKLFVVLQPTQ